MSVFKDKRWVCDTESDGLLNEATRFWCMSVIELNNSDNRLFFGPDEVNEALVALFEDAALVAGHNFIAHDCALAEKLLGIKIDRSKIRDTLVMSRLANSAREIPAGAKNAHSVDAWARRFGLSKPSHEDWSQFSDEMRHRNEQDTYLNLLILKAVLRELKTFSRESQNVEHSLSWLLSDMHREGFYLDQEKAMALYVETKSKADRIQRDIRSVFGPKPYLLREVDPKPTKAGGYSRAQTKCVTEDAETVGGPFSLIEFREFNLDSPTQRVERLIQKGWVPKSFTDKGNPRFDADEMTPEDYEGMPDEVKLLGTYLMLRSRERTASQWLDLVDSNSYVHGEIRSIGAHTHRAAHARPNLANIPSVEKDKITKQPLMGIEGLYGYECRDCWGADPRIPNQVLVGMDLASIQLRAFAHYAGDRDYINLVCDSAVDMHIVHAEYLGGVEKKVSKRFIYAFLLGAGIPKLGSILGGGEREGREAVDLFMEKVPGVRKLKQTLIPQWAKQGYLVALDGRKVPVLSKHLSLAGALQSFEKCVIAHSMVELVNTFGKSITLRAWPHDEDQLTCDKSLATEVGETFKTIVRGVGERFGSLSPLDADYKVGLTWAETH